MPTEKLVERSGLSGLAPRAMAAEVSTGSAETGSSTPFTLIVLAEE
jgi:hypothetical protein